MTRIQVHRLNVSPAVAEAYQLPPEKLLAGNPTQPAWMRYTDPTGRFCTGLWQSELGAAAVAERRRLAKHVCTAFSSGGARRVVASRWQCLIS